MKENTITINTFDEKDFNHNQSQLKRYGYKRTHNCYWSEIWEKDGCKSVVLNR